MFGWLIRKLGGYSQPSVYDVLDSLEFGPKTFDEIVRTVQQNMKDEILATDVMAILSDLRRAGVVDRDEGEKGLWRAHFASHRYGDGKVLSTNDIKPIDPVLGKGWTE